MALKRTIELHCPTCKAVVAASDPEFPFCTERCRTIDLGKWASGAYVIRSLVQDTPTSLAIPNPMTLVKNDISEE